jgi:two-component system chemotaxis response regulator CheB
MRPRHLVVIGASSGGIEAMRHIVAGLPADFPAAIAVVQHTSPHAPSVLHSILEKAGKLPAVSPTDTDELRAGTIYVAPPNYHLLVEPGRVYLGRGPKENRFRPAIDPLFRSAAKVFGPNAIGVVLTGNLDDGSAGLWAIKELGGVAIVQDPADAMYPSMPKNAIAHVDVDYVVPLSGIARLLVEVTAAPKREFASQIPESMEIEVKIATQEDPLEAGVGRLGAPSVLTCPECHGVLLQLKEGGRKRFRCHTGHAYSTESLLVQIQEQVEIHLWNTIRTMQEGNVLMRSMAEHAKTTHPSVDSGALFQRAEELHRHANTLRQMIICAEASDRIGEVALQK